MKLKSYNRNFFLYVKEDGKQYIDKEKAKLYEKLEGLPENVAEFQCTMKTVPAEQSSLGSDASLRYLIDTRGAQSDDPETKALAVQARQESEKKLMPQTAAAYRNIASAIVSWNLENEDGTLVPINEDSLKKIEPPWLFDYIREVYSDLNEMDMRVRRD